MGVIDSVHFSSREPVGNHSPEEMREDFVISVLTRTPIVDASGACEYGSRCIKNPGQGTLSKGGGHVKEKKTGEQLPRYGGL